jgi:cyclophilin family peptidyl-prolyl cis-trans isomerase
MRKTIRTLMAVIVVAIAPRAFAATLTTQVRFATTLGNINVTLLPDSAPNTVANFLKYVNRGAYDNSLFHRSVPGFIVQGGGYFVGQDTINPVPADPPIASEAKVSNTRGTLAMALVGTDANSASNQWYFNLTNNTALDSAQLTGGPFTVFGQASDAASLAVLDSISAQQLVDVSANAGPAFTSLPVVNFNGALEFQNLIYVNSIDAIPPAGLPDYSTTASPAQLSIASQQTGTTTLTVTPSNGYQGTVVLACGALPSSVGCTFAPPTLTFAAGSAAAQTSTLTISTKATTAMNGSFGSGSASLAGLGTGSALTALAGLFGLACIAAVSLARSKRPVGVALVLGVGLVAAAGGCNSNNPAQAPFNVPIRLSDGTLSHPVALSVIIH